MVHKSTINIHGSTPVVDSITGTDNEILANGSGSTPQTGSITLSLDSDLILPGTLTSNDTVTLNDLSVDSLVTTNSLKILTSANLSGDVSTAGLITTIGVNKVTDAMLRQSAGLSLIGRSTNTSGNVADITAASDNQVFRRSGTTVAFGAIDLSQSNAVGISKLGLVNGGTNADLSATGGAAQYLKQSSAGAAITVGTISAGDIVNGAALTKTDDTNITLTLGGSPTTALLAAASLTLGWSGQLSGARGGTGVDNTGKTITLGGNLTTSGAFNSTFTMTGTTAVTFPTSGTLATTAGTVSSITGTANQVLANSTSGIAQIGAVALTLAAALILPGTFTSNDTVTLNNLTASKVVFTDSSKNLTSSGTVGEIQGGTGQTTYTLGDTLYSSAANTLSKLAGNITTAKQYLSQTGNGSVSAAPVWATISGSDITGAALTKVDDTNVTLTLGGTPTTALLRAASLTLGWSGQLSGARGGTGVDNTGKTITLGGNLTTSGAFNSTFTMTGTTTVTFPTSGTLATTAGTVSSITGTANQVLANGTSGSAQTGAVTLTLPQNIGTSSLPQFQALTLSGTGSALQLRNDVATSGQGISVINFLGLNSAASLKFYGRITGTLLDNTAGSEDFEMLFSIIENGVFTSYFEMDGFDQAIYAYRKINGTDLNLSNLTASQAVVTDSSKNLTSLAYASANTVSTLVQRDGSGNFSAGTITAALSGNATTSTTSTNIAGGALGSVPYQSAAATTALLAGNTTTAKQYLSQTGDGAVSAAPVWATISGSDITGAALTKTDDTNVTLTLGGTPTTALLRAASLTLGWTGQLANSRGGTGQDSSAWAQGDLPYISATGTWNHLAKNTSSTRYLSNTGTTNNPAWAQIDLTSGVTGDLPFANLAQGAALSVLGVTGNAIADVASIVAASDNQVFRRSGTAVAFGAINLASASAVSGILANANTTATDANTASTIMARDASGNFSASTITATAITVSNSSTANIDITTSAASAVSSGIKITGARNSAATDFAYIELWNRDADYATGLFANPSKLVEIIGATASATIPQGRFIIRLNDGAGTQKASLTLNYGDGSAGTQLAGIANSSADRFRFYDANTGSTLGPILDFNASNPCQITCGSTLAVMPTSKFGIGIISPISTTHIYESTSSTGTAAGLTIEQGSTGDAILQYLLTGSTRYQCGIDNSNGDAYTEGFSSTFGTTPNRIVTTAGIQTMPLQPLFYAYANANITNVTGDNTTYTIVYNTKSFDQGNNFSSTTLTAPVTAKYHFDVTVSLANFTSSHTVAFGRIVVAGTSAGSYPLFIVNPANMRDANNNLQITGGVTITLTSGDTVTTTVTVVNSTKTVTLLGAAITNGQQSSFSGYLVG